MTDVAVIRRSGPPSAGARPRTSPGELSMSGRTTAGEALAHLARLRGGRGLDRIPELADRFGLDLGRPLRGLSKGNKQKVGVVQAFMHDPELLVLDEPTSGLDPLLQHEFLSLVREARDGGATVFMSSHVLSEVEEVAGRVAIIRAGRLVDVDDVRTLRRRAGQRVELRFVGHVTSDAFADLAGVTDATVRDGGDGTTTLRCEVHGEPDALLKAALAAVSAVYIAFWPSMSGGDLQSLVDSMPEGLVTAMGYDRIGTAAGYLTSTVYGLLGPVLLLVFAIGSGARLLAGEEEDGTLELEFTAPVSRRQVDGER